MRISFLRVIPDSLRSTLLCAIGIPLCRYATNPASRFEPTWGGGRYIVGSILPGKDWNLPFTARPREGGNVCYIQSLNRSVHLQTTAIAEPLLGHSPIPTTPQNACVSTTRPLSSQPASEEPLVAL